ncbi:MAG: cohesin domain-containing protein [Clostridia bacterium]|nr:cohesin domain-containing protein [Clostridia bacterium]
MNIITKRITVLLCAVLMQMAMFVTVQAQGISIKAADVIVEQGSGTETVNVPIIISDNKGVIGMKLTFSYDSEIILTKVTQGAALNTLTMTPPGNLNANPFNVVWDGLENNDISNGTIVTLSFSVPKGTVKDYRISVNASSVVDENLNYLDAAAENGKISVHVHNYGAWEKADGNNHKKTCECGNSVTEAHKWDGGIVTKEATHTSTGEKKYTCTECHAERIEEIPVRPHITATTVEQVSDSYKFNVSCDDVLHDEKVIVAAYDENGRFICVSMAIFDGKKNVYVLLDKNIEIKYAKVFVWSGGLSPLAKEETVSSGF